MINEDSILRRLPGQLDRKQLLFLDGIRHAVEIICLAYTRLQSTLTRIAHEDDTSTWNKEVTPAFLDAWAVVDAIDRLRALFQLLPGSGLLDSDAAATFQEISQPVRNLRNVGDHLAQRADYVIAHDGTALGALSWFTALVEDGSEGIICTLVPGTIQRGQHPVVNPGGREGVFPTSLIELYAGEHKACISEVIPHVESLVRQLEHSISEALNEVGLDGKQAGTDILIKMSVKAAKFE